MSGNPKSVKLTAEFLLITILAAFSSCSNEGSTTSPLIVSSPKIKSPREMEWSADTLKLENSFLDIYPFRMLGFSSKDIWLCGWADPRTASTWHFDGSKWQTDNLVRSGINIPFEQIGLIPFDFAGKSSNDLWAGGYCNDYLPDDYCAFAHFDGQKWTRYPHIEVKGGILDMTKDPEGNIWACGRNGAVFNYSGGRWITDSIKLFGNFDYCDLLSIEYHNGKMAVLGRTINSAEYRYYHFSGTLNNWTIRDSFVVNSSLNLIKFGDHGIKVTKEGQLFSYGGGGIWQYKNGAWEKSYTADSEIYNMFCLSSDYVLAVGPFEKTLFYNGASWVSFYDKLPFANRFTSYTDVWTDGGEIYMVGYSERYNTIIWHGK